MEKEILAEFRLKIPAQEASPQPPVGPALGQRGINIMDFCKKFNEATKIYPKGAEVTAHVTVYKDRTYTFRITAPTVSYLLKKAANIESGSSEPGKKIVGKIKKSQIVEIAKIKLQDLNTRDINAAIKMIEGSAKSMGLQIIE